MKNEVIIFEKRLELMEEGIIRSTGELIEYQLPSGEWIKVPEPIQIHTLKQWANLQYSVNDGEKPIATFKIWKPYMNKKGHGIVFKNADFYSLDQVHPWEV